MRKMKRIHFLGKTPNGFSERVIFLCGKDVSPLHPGANSTTVLDNVTCLSCLEVLKEDNWFCPEHGFIADANVTYEETCANCGRFVAN